ncbi:MAG: GntR family transcriptional regulator [Phycisphaeraceae bacterium]|nr:GntR family transcriptional regulator [Phycisphaeraceae bacterium]
MMSRSSIARAHLALPTGRKSQRVYYALLEQLRDGGFTPGQQFFTINEISGKYGISASTAVRCLDRLVEKGLVERRQGSGTYVKQTPVAAESTAEKSTLHSVDCMMPEDILDRAGPEFLSDEILSCAHGSHAGAYGCDKYELALRISLLPRQVQTPRQIERWMERRVEAGARAFIFRWMPRSACIIAQRRGWPACILGTPEVGVTLPSIGYDQQQIGQCISRYLIMRGCQHVAILMRSEWRRGDNVMVNTVLEELGSRLVAIETAAPCDDEVDEAVGLLIDRQPQIDALILRNHLGRVLPEKLPLLTAGPRKLVVISEMHRMHPMITPVVPVGQTRIDAISGLLRRLIAGDRSVGSVTFPGQVLDR